MKKVFLLTVLFLVSFLTEAQGVLTINGANTSVPTLYVTNGAHLYVSGGVNIVQSGSPAGATGDYLQNNGTIQIVTDKTAGQGDFTNNVSGLTVYTTGQTTGTVIFSDSNETQNITGGGTIEFMNLSVNKSNTKLDLEENITVDGTLDLGGVVNVEASTLTLSTTGTLTGAPYSSDNMIQADSTGQFIQGVTAGAGSFLFPVGDGSPAYSPVTINFVANASAGTLGLNLRPVADPNINNPTAAQDYIKRYWTFTNTALTTYTYTGNFNYLSSDIVGTENLMRVSRWASPWYQEFTSTAGGDVLTISPALDQILAPLSGDFTGRNVSCSTTAGTITAAQNKDTICSGATQTLTVIGNTAAVQWQLSLTGNNFTTIPGADSATFLVQPSQTTYYRTFASGQTCSDTSSQFILVVNTRPSSATPTVADSIICSGDSTQVCALSGYTSYLWNTGATTSCIEASGSQPYWVTVTGSNGCSNITGNVIVPNYSVPSVSIVHEGDTLSAFGEIGYQWYRNGFPIQGATSNIEIASQSGVYSVEITDPNGCKAMSSDVSVGINEITNTTGVEIYPNPATGSFNISYRGPATTGCQLVMFNIIGERVLEETLDLSTTQIVPVIVGQLPKGVYLVQLQSESISLTRKIVVQ